MKSFLTSLKIFSIITFSMMISSVAANSFMTSPPKLSFKFNRGIVRTIYIINKDSKTLRMQISKVYYAPGAKTGPYKNDSILSKKAYDFDLTPYMRLSTKKIIVPVGKSRAIKLLISKPKHKLKPGTYKAFIYFKTIPTKVRVSKKKLKGVGVAVNLIFNQNSSVTGAVGKGYPFAATYKCIRHDGHVKLDITNPTSWQVNFKTNILNKSGKMLKESVQYKPVLPYTKGTRELNLKGIDVSDVAKLTWMMNKKPYSVMCHSS